jgi:hypothetical protein
MQPGAQFAVLASMSNAGSVIMGKAFDIGLPYIIGARGVADMNGDGSVSFSIPNHVPVNTIGYIEAGAMSALGVDESNMLTILVL